MPLDCELGFGELIGFWQIFGGHFKISVKSYFYFDNRIIVKEYANQFLLIAFIEYLMNKVDLKGRNSRERIVYRGVAILSTHGDTK